MMNLKYITVDEFKIYNRVLTSNEISKLYKYNLNKYDTNSWKFITENTNLIDWDHTYSACATDIVDSTTCLTERTITISVSNKDWNNDKFLDSSFWKSNPNEVHNSRRDQRSWNRHKILLI